VLRNPAVKESGDRDARHWRPCGFVGVTRKWRSARVSKRDADLDRIAERRARVPWAGILV